MPPAWAHKENLPSEPLSWDGPLRACKDQACQLCRSHKGLDFGNKSLECYFGGAGCRLLLPRDAICFSKGSTSLEKWFHYQFLFPAALLLTRLGKSEHFKEALGSCGENCTASFPCTILVAVPGLSTQGRAGSGPPGQTPGLPSSAQSLAFPQCGI